MSGLNIKDRVKNNKLNLSGLNITEIPVKEIVSTRLSYLQFPAELIPSQARVSICYARLTSLFSRLCSPDRPHSTKSDLHWFINMPLALTYKNIFSQRLKFDDISLFFLGSVENHSPGSVKQQNHFNRCK